VNARAERLFADYAEAHRTSGNRACHAVGIPLIVASSVLALSTVRIGGPWTAAEPVVLAMSAMEIALDVRLGGVFLVFAGACDLAARGIISGFGATGALVLAATLFAAGWGFQLIGHAVYEKNRPAFMRNLRHLLIGPLWIARKAIRRA